MEKILVSACLLGHATRYDGKSKGIISEQLTKWQQQGRLVIVCPEVDGGLPIPRPAAEIQVDQVITTSGENVTSQFSAGAQAALKLVQQHHIRFALLKSGSPSCGNELIYDGTFTGTKTRGQGVTAALLGSQGVKVFNELQLGELQTALSI